MSLRTLLAAMAALAPGSLLGQGGAGITGFVTDTAGRPLADAQVVVSPSERDARTDASGRFRLTGLPPGQYVVTARRMGYRPSALRVDLRRGEIVPLAFSLAVGVRTLDTVTVAAPCPSRSFAGFLCRKQSGAGTYLDVRAIDSADAFDVKQLFWKRPGFRLTPTGIEATSGWKCVSFVVNGDSVNTTTNALPDTPAHLIGVEIYVDPDDVPPAYQRFVWKRVGKIEYRCSVVVYWTLVRPRRR